MILIHGVMHPRENNKVEKGVCCLLTVRIIFPKDRHVFNILTNRLLRRLSYCILLNSWVVKFQGILKRRVLQTL